MSSNSRGNGAWVRGRGSRFRGNGKTTVATNIGGTSKAPRQMQMELIASVSRSSGLEKDGDALKDFSTQEKYRAFIQEKVDAFWKSHSVWTTETDKEAMNRRDKQENILILFRKLREGLVASKRADKFAVEVYETSAYLAIIFHSPRDSTTPLSHLVPDIYSAMPSPLLHLTTLVSLLHHLVAAYPSQGTFRQHLQGLPPSFLPSPSESHTWIHSLTSSLRMMNYSKFEELTRPASFAHLLQIPKESNTSCSHPSRYANVTLAENALHTLIDSLRNKAREKTWQVVRSAYREITCHPNVGTTRDWLTRSLALPSVAQSAASLDVYDWLEKKSTEGQVRKKEGVEEGRWIICKVR